jgi:hypothetical protein
MMNKALTAAALALACAVSPMSPANGAVVRMAPNFAWEGPPGANSLRSLKGQPVVLLVAKSARSGAFRAQVKKLREVYQEFAGRKVIFAAAILNGPPDIRTDIPFVLATNGAQVAAEFGVSDSFNIIIIGRDGNVDYQTSRVLPPSRVRDVVVNSFVEQSGRRK